MRWLLLDEVLTIERKIQARTRSHIPHDTSVTPELLLIEMMAQTGALLVGAENDFREDLIFAKMEEASFHPGYSAGERIEIEAASDQLRPEGAWIQGKIFRAGEPVAQAKFFLMNVGHLLEGRTEPITFHDAFMNHFKIREKVK